VNPKQRAPGSQTALRDANRSRLVQAVRDQGAMTQVELVGATGLSAATVSNLVRELAGERVHVLAPSTRSGRRAVLVSLAAREGLLGGIAFGDRDIRVAVSDGGMQVLGQQRMPLPADHHADEGMERAARLLSDIVERAGARMSDLTAVGFGLPAPVDSVTGEVGSEAILPGWRGVPVAEAMEARLRAPVRLDNTANLAALGELRSGALRGVGTGCYIKASYGVGAGLIINGTLFRGSAGTAGEIGHLTIDENGPICRCGNRGCLDTFVGSRALLDALAVSHGQLTLRDVLTRTAEGDPGCRRVVADAGRHIGVAAAGLVNLLNPEVIVVGGQLARVGEVVLGPLREAIERCAIPSAGASVEVVGAELGEEAELVGALSVAAQLHRESSTSAG
jgi:predicted NBD/HSP70 family sugar kinase